MRRALSFFSALNLTMIEHFAESCSFLDIETSHLPDCTDSGPERLCVLRGRFQDAL